MWKEFKTFIMRGNVMDMAVGIIIGAAFGKIVTSLVNDIIMPPIGMIIGRVDFSSLVLPLSLEHLHDTMAQAKADHVVTLNYGTFLNTVIEFLIVAFAVFMLIKWVNRILPKPAAAPTTKECGYCKMNIPIAATRCPNCTSQLSAA
ncbi:MAG TPA: large-conductance mechanosensitive channel protein MscL [Terriglobia bacterium]|nr:large-conductance mechanosensitive channel protein MscL [Terriglobia bacterium]